MVKKIIKAILPKRILKLLRYFRGKYFSSYSLKSYSQEGEDMVLRRIFEGSNSGFYVDVGAHHPKRFSNTFFFYKNGWKGINIDAMPGSMTLFNKIRPRDINIEVPISAEKQTLTYFIFNDPALNGFSEELSLKRENELNGYYIQDRIDIETSTLKDIFDKNLSQNQNIDFLSIDVEGLDYEVLLSNDFTKYRPTLILIEILENDLFNIAQHKISKYLEQVGYVFFAKTMNTVIFKKMED